MGLCSLRLTARTLEIHAHVTKLYPSAQDRRQSPRKQGRDAQATHLSGQLDVLGEARRVFQALLLHLRHHVFVALRLLQMQGDVSRRGAHSLQAAEAQRTRLGPGKHALDELDKHVKQAPQVIPAALVLVLVRINGRILAAASKLRLGALRSRAGAPRETLRMRLLRCASLSRALLCTLPWSSTNLRASPKSIISTRRLSPPAHARARGGRNPTLRQRENAARRAARRA